MEYTEITVEKIKNNIYVATTNLLAPLKCEISMRGESAENAKEKLIKLLMEE
jgi:hypothetical protein